MLDHTLALIAPHHCYGCGMIGSVLCECCKTDILDEQFLNCVVCGSPQVGDNLCRGHKKEYERLWCVAKRADVTERLIDAYKFHGVRAAYAACSRLLYERLPELPPATVIVPIPTAPRNLRIRGYDHMLLVARELGRLSGLQVTPLLRRRNNVTQHFAKTAAERKKQAQEFFEVRERLDGTPPYLLIDDIFTTGATLDAAARCLWEAGAEMVWAVVIARQVAK